MAWNEEYPLTVQYHYVDEASGNSAVMDGRVDSNGQPILTPIGHEISLYGVDYVVERIVWHLFGDDSPWNRTEIVVYLTRTK